jgi:predicted GNAT family N-acyltransferase
MVNVHKITGKEELEQAFAIRQQVFVIEQNVAPEEEYDEYESSSQHYLAEINGQPAGTARWRQTDKGIKLERFAVLEQYRDRKIGSTLLKTALTDILPLKPAKVYLHAQVQVIPFYEKHGFKTEGEEFIEAEIRHKLMVYKGAK